MHFGPETTDKVVALLASGFSTYDRTNDNQLNTHNMKKTYLPPFVEVQPFTIECDILTTSYNGSSSNLNIVDQTEEDDWTY